MSSQIQIILKLNTISKICFKHKNIYEIKSLWQYILYYIPGKGSHKNRLIHVTKQRKFGLKKKVWFFYKNIFGSTIILMFIFDVVVDIILHSLCWFYLTYSLRVYYVMQYKIIENCLKAIKDTISKNRIINLEYILCQQNKVNIRILISKIF